MGEPGKPLPSLLNHVFIYYYPRGLPPAVSCYRAVNVGFSDTDGTSHEKIILFIPRADDAIRDFKRDFSRINLSPYPRSTAFAPRLIAAAAMSESSVIVLVPLRSGARANAKIVFRSNFHLSSLLFPFSFLPFLSSHPPLRYRCMCVYFIVAISGRARDADLRLRQ